MRMCTECHLWLKEPRRKIKISNKDISNEDIDREKSKKSAGVVNMLCCTTATGLAHPIFQFVSNGHRLRTAETSKPRKG